MASFPTSIWTPSVRGTNMSDAVTQTDILDAQNAELVAIETEAGTSPSGVYATITARLLALDQNVNITASTSFTPTFTNFTVGNGAVSGARTRVGPIVYVDASLVFGSSSSFAGDVGLTLPVTAVSLQAGAAYYLDSGTREWVGSVRFSSSTGVILVHSESGNSGRVNATSPHTWAVNDVVRISVIYLAA